MQRKDVPQKKTAGGNLLTLAIILIKRSMSRATRCDTKLCSPNSTICLANSGIFVWMAYMPSFRW